MSLPFLPLLSGDDRTDIEALHGWLVQLIYAFANAVGSAIDPVDGQGGDGSLTIVGIPGDIVYTPTSKLSLDDILTGSIQIDYTLPDRAVGIIILYKESSSNIFKTSFANDSPQSLINLSVGVDYDIQIAGYAANGSVGPYSPLVSLLIPTDSATVLPPTNLTALLSNNTVTLTWSSPIGVQPVRYGVQRATNSTFTSGVFNTTIDSTTLSDVLTTGGTYYYRVRSVNSIGGFSAYSSSVNVTSSLFTLGSVVFVGASGVLAQDNSNLFWDDTNNRLGVGNNTPTASLDVQGVNNSHVLIGNLASSPSYGAISLANDLSNPNYNLAVNPAILDLLINVPTGKNIYLSEGNAVANMIVKAGGNIVLLLAGIPIYANNAAAVTGGLAVGSLYRIGADPDHLCIVH